MAIVIIQKKSIWSPLYLDELELELNLDYKIRL